MFKKILVGALAGLGFAGSALAADLPSRYSAPVAPYVEPFTWTGIYGGINGGYNFGNTKTTLSAGGESLSWNPNQSGFVGGAHLGVNWQIAPIFVIGVEAMGQYAAGNANYTVQNELNTSANARFITTLTGRAGLAFGNLLVYGKAGYAGADVRASGDVSGVGSIYNGTNWHNGWTVGTGAEFALTSHWIAGVEYNYIRLQNASYNTNGTLIDGLNANVKPTTNQIIGRISYKF